MTIDIDDLADRVADAVIDAATNYRQLRRGFDHLYEDLDCANDARRDIGQAAIRAYEAAQWQPIETAPEGSSKIILAWSADRHMAFQVCWNEGQEPEEGRFPYPAGWAISGESRPAVGHKFTDWRPLPDGPKGDPE